MKCESLSKMPGVRSHCGLVCFALLSLSGFFMYAGTVSKQDTVWKRYYNPLAKFCVSYPARWYKGDAFEGSGLYVIAGIKKHSRAVGEIDVSVFRTGAKNEFHNETVSLTEDFRAHVEGLKKFERAERVQIVDQHPTQISGSGALYTKDTYYDPQDRSDWTEEVLFIRKNQDVYRLELECKSDQLLRFDRVFTELVNSFALDCGETHQFQR